MSDSVVTLSYSTIEYCLQPENSHNWINKQMGREIPSQIYFDEGKICHRLIQDHVAGIKEHEDLKHIPLEFDIVEVDEKDKNTEFVFNINDTYEKITGKKCPLKKRYDFHGFRDGIKKDFSSMLEIKSSSTMWSIGRFMKAMQRKCYGFDDRLKFAYLITCTRDPKLWKRVKPKYFKLPYTKKDLIDAIEWIVEGALVVDNGQFRGGLEGHNCIMPRCSYGYNCYFKQERR